MKLGEGLLKPFIAGYYKDTGWKAQEIMQAMTNLKDLYASEIV